MITVVISGPVMFVFGSQILIVGIINFDVRVGGAMRAHLREISKEVKHRKT
jgi:hypothetical protein